MIEQSKYPTSLWILVARTDVPYMLQTISHLVNSCNYPFKEKVLAMDTAPLTGDKVYRYGIATPEELENTCQSLVNQGVIDKIVKIDYTPSLIKEIYQKYFGIHQGEKMLNHTHNWKGSTIYASLYCIEACTTDYYLHFDADMLLYQDNDFNWIDEAIKLMNSVSNIAMIRPLCGPPHPENKVFHPNSFVKDERGFFAHKSFSMRAYLLEKERFAQLSPIPLMWKYPPLYSRFLPQPLKSFSAKIERRLRGFKTTFIQGAVESFEPMTSKRLEMTDFVRADLSSPKAWTIHPPKHTKEFIEALPKLIQLIEAGKYPPSQAGYYDLILAEWRSQLENMN